MNELSMPEKNKDIDLFLKIGKWEGYSYLLLLLVAMPLKYFADMPLAVRYVGSLHGVLFVAFIYTIVVLFNKKSFDMLQSIKALILSIIPFGTFFLKKLLK